MKTYLCEDTPESILTSIYDAWADPVKNSEISLELCGSEQLTLFTEYARTEPSYEKAIRVMDSIERKLGAEVHHVVEGILASAPADKADALFRFLRYAFKKGRYVMNDLAEPVVMRAFELNRKARSEAHAWIEFVRFEEIGPDIFFSKIGPKNNVLPLIADHFAGRYNTQAFMIYDENRKMSIVYSPGHNWYFQEGDMSELLTGLRKTDHFETLWKTFFDSTMIKERINPVCQRNHCPIHYRKYMLEFS